MEPDAVVPPSKVKRSAETSDNYEKPAIKDRQVLGQTVVGLGDLYDARRDRYFAGISLWSEKKINESKRRQNQLSSKTVYSAKKTLKEKLDEMDISASLTLDFLGGLVSVTGNAEFYRQSSSLESEDIFDVIYETTSHADILPVRTPQDYATVCASKDATHVVSQVLYGQRGFLSFKQRKSESSEQQKIHGSLQAIVKNAFLSVRGQAAVDLKAYEKELSASTEMRMSGDFIMDTMPTSFSEAIQTFKELARSNGKSPNTMPVKPVKVQLMPLWKYCDESAAILIRISNVLIDEVSKVLDNIEKLEMKVNTLLSSQPATKFQAVAKNLDIYRTYLRKFQLIMKGKLQVILPAVRGKKGKSEADLVQLINEYLHSPLMFGKSSRFLSRRNREISAIQFLLDNFGFASQRNIEISDYNSATDVGISLKYKYVVIFAVNILQPKKVTESFVNGGEVDESIFWFNNLTSVGYLGGKIRLFKSFAAANKGNNNIFYLVKINKKQSNPVDVTAMKGMSHSTFQIPVQPEKPALISKSHDSITIRVASSTNPFVTKFFVVYWNILEGEENRQKTNLLNFSQKNTYTIGDLNPATSYKYRVVHYTEFGNSPPSPVGDVVMTTPSSPPSNLMVKTKNIDFVTATWEQPLKVGKGIRIDGYTASIYRNKTLVGTKDVQTKTVTFQNLLSAQKYTVKVVATTRITTTSNETGTVTSQFSSNPATVESHTFPTPPDSINIVSTDLNSVSITWNKPKIAAEAQLLRYVVKYDQMDSTGSNKILGTEKVHSALKNLHTTVTGLAQGTSYGFRVKVVTSAGSSPFSEILIARTQYNFTELDRLKESMVKSTEASFQELGKNVTSKLNTLDSSMSRRLQNVFIQLRRFESFFLPYVAPGLMPFGASYGDVLQARGDDLVFLIETKDAPNLPWFMKAINPETTSLQVLNDGSIIVGTGNSRNPASNSGPVIAGYADDLMSDSSSYVYIRTSVKGDAQKTIDSAINRYLFMHKQPAFFYSKFVLLVTYENILRYTTTDRQTFQIAIASDGIHSFAVLSYTRLDRNADYGVGYYNKNCGGYQELVSKQQTRTLVSTSNIGVMGKHVMSLDC